MQGAGILDRFAQEQHVQAKFALLITNRADARIDAEAPPGLRHLAQAMDALFVTADGAISEGSIWNIGFFDGERIVWPRAPMLRGISMQLLQDGLERGGIVGRATIVGCVEDSPSPWFFGKYGFVLKDAAALPFQAVRGRLGFFDPTQEQDGPHG